MTALSLCLALGAGACGATPQVAQDVSRPGGRGDARDSLFRAANLRDAVARVRGRVGPAGPVTTLRLEAGAITLGVQEGAASESVVVTKRLTLTHVPAPPTADQPPIPLAQIDPAAPERIAAAVAQRTGAGLKDIDFFAVDREPGTSSPRWLVYLRRGRGTFAASLAGAELKPVSDASTTAGSSPSTPTPTPTPTPTAPAATPTPSTRSSPPSDARARQHAACLRAAGKDKTKIAACKQLAGP